MAEVPNLLDMFQNNRKDARAIKPAAEAKSHGAANLLPVDPTAARTAGAKAGKGSSSPFQAKVEKSKAKLAAKGHKFFAQNKPAAKAETPAAKPAIKEAAAAERPEAAQAPVRKERAEGQSQNAARPERAQPGNTAKADRAIAKGMDAESADAIKEGLQDLGIEATEAQLNDPAYLMDMLRLLQSLPSVAELAGEAEGAMSVDAAGAETAGQAAQTLLPLADEDEAAAEEAPAADAKAPKAAGEKISRSELADLIGGRAAGLNQAAASEQVQVTAQAPTTTPKEWQGIQVRPQAEGPGTQPLPMADLDRLRVMQASAMHVEGGAEKSGGDLSIETDSQEPAAIDGLEASAASGEADGEGNTESQADLSGRNGDRAGTAEASAHKDGPLVAKDGATGSQFNQALDQARTVDHRASIQRSADPRAAGPEAGVMEQITKKMAAAEIKNGDTISIQLAPEHLGKVRVSLEMRDGVMAARIAVENDAVRKQVEDSLGSLKDALQNQGIQLQGLEVSVDQRHTDLFNPDGSNAQSFFGRNGRRGEQGEGGPGAEAAPFESAPEADTGRRWGYNTMEYIG